MTELSQLPATPSAAPPSFADTALLMRQTLSNAAAGLAPTGYAVPYAMLAPAILPKSTVTAGGTSAGTASAITTPIALIVGATAGGGVVLRGIEHDTQTLLNASGQAVLVYPPPGGTINGTTGAVQVVGTAQFHSVDGVAYYAAL